MYYVFVLSNHCQLACHQEERHHSWKEEQENKEKRGEKGCEPMSSMLGYFFCLSKKHKFEDGQ